MEHPRSFQARDLSRVRVLVVNRYPVERLAIRAILSENPCFAVIEEIGVDGETADFFDGKSYDLVILSSDTVDNELSRTVREIKQESPRSAVLVMVASDESFVITSLIHAGADGIFLKSDPDRDLLKASTALSRGRRFLSSTLEGQFGMGIFSEASKLLHTKLTRREWQIMVLMSTGKTLTQIGSELSLSAKTVSAYRGKILDKLQINSNAHLIRYVMAHNLFN